jgi:molybdenum-dependent DNA-binding transcriptional regulator ModE
MPPLLGSDDHNKVWGKQAMFKIKNTNNKTSIYREAKAVKHVYRAAEDETEAVEQLYQAVEIRSQRRGKL